MLYTVPIIFPSNGKLKTKKDYLNFISKATIVQKSCSGKQLADFRIKNIGGALEIAWR